MISASKLNALRLSLQPLTSINSSITGPTPTPLLFNMPTSPAPLSTSTRPKKPRLSPIPDSTLCSPTPTRAAFLLTPTRYGLRRCGTESDVTSPVTSTSPCDPRSPLLSTCVCEGCLNPVQSERNACTSCREVFYDILAKQIGMSQMRSPVLSAASSRASAMTAPMSPSHMHVENVSQQLPKVPESTVGIAPVSLVSLSVSHPRPNPIQTSGATISTKKLIRGLPEPSSPDALYFGGKRSRQAYTRTKRGRSHAVSSTNFLMRDTVQQRDVEMTE